jgi:small subunit ribosomal protein S1
MTQSKPFDAPEAASDASFGDILTQFEQSHHADGGTVEGTVVSVAADAVFVDIGRKMDGIMPPLEGHTFKPGDKVIVSLRGRDEEGNYLLSTVKVEVPKDWTALEAAFASKSTIAGTVLELVKGGLRVDVGVPAFMPASRSGAREMADLEKLVGQSIECRITKLDKDDEDVVVDRRVVLEEMERAAKQERFAALEEGSIIRGTVRTITDFGAFVDLGGVDGLLHVSDMTYQRGIKPADVVTVGQEIDVKILKINRESRKDLAGLEAAHAGSWSLVAEKYPQGSTRERQGRARGRFRRIRRTRTGIEGLIHVSEMSVDPQESEAGRHREGRRIGRRHGAGREPHRQAHRARTQAGSGRSLGRSAEEVSGRGGGRSTVTSLAKFGAFVDMGDGLEGMIHIGDISREKRLNHPSEVLKEKQTVRAQVTEQDKERRRFRLSMKALEPTSIDEYIAENKVGDVVAGASWTSPDRARRSNWARA